jgi:acyl carrier protein
MNDLIVLLNEIRPGKDFAGASDFFQQGILDSLDLTTLVSALEERYGIFIDVDELVVENFRNIAAISSLLARKNAHV